jgi:hypothetical protein
MNGAVDRLAEARGAAARGDWRAVVALTGPVLEESANEPTALMYEGIARAALGEWRAAAAPLNRLARLAPDIGEVHVYRAQVAQMTGDPVGHMAALRDVARCQPDNATALQQLARTALFFGDPEAPAYLARALERAPGDADLVLAREALAAVAPASGQPDRVVLVSDMPRVREAKIGAALRAAGWDVHLLCARAPSYPPEPFFASCTLFQSPWQAVRLAAALEPSVCHVFSLMQYETAAAFLAARPAPVIVDPYDNADMLSDAFVATEPGRHMDRALERSVFARADGLVCRNLETQVAVHRDGLELAGPRLFFSDYCWGDIAPRPRLSDRDGELHLVYGGTVWLENRSHAGADHGLLWLAELAAANGVHLHAYPTVADAETFDTVLADYRALERGTRFFHLHRPVADHRAFLEEISQYDVGVLVRRSLVTGGQAWQYAPDKHRFSYANKLADYLDAGLAFMIAPQHFLSFGLARRLGVAVPATPEMFGAGYWDALKDRLLHHRPDFATARGRWDLTANAARLGRFYAQVAGAGN